MWNVSTWDVAGNWEKAREFTISVINESQGISQSEREKLLRKEQDLATYNFKKSAGFWYSEEERKEDIANYSRSLYDFAKNQDLPEQVKTVFASLADTTHTIGITKGNEYKDPEFKIPKWVWFGVAGAAFLMWKK